MENKFSNDFNLKDEILRYISFWPYFLISTALIFILTYIYLRYTNYVYLSVAKIEIVDKAQDSEMALPTAMTIFNRSMINLDNEIGVLSSFSLHQKAVSAKKSNIKFFKVGKLKTLETHPDEWISQYELNFKIDTDTIKKFSEFLFTIDDGKLTVEEYDESDFKKAYKFDDLSTLSNSNELPFTLKINSFDDEDDSDFLRKIIFYPFESTVDYIRSNVEITTYGTDSDQLILSYLTENRKIGNEYLNQLLIEFDQDGIRDRQLEYKTTMDFVDNRSKFLQLELEKIEINKQNFKENNNLSDINYDANINIQQQFNYDADLFKAKSQRDLISILRESIEENIFNLMPFNIGVENSNINNLISDYNNLINEKEKFSITVGQNNPYLKKYDEQLTEIYQNIVLSIDNYDRNLLKTISNLEDKEKEFESVYRSIPENEKILRSIERELQVKESLFLLLLQKREEASINYAVVKPSIKIIDYARSNPSPVSPKKRIYYFASIFFGLMIPFTIIYIFFYFDNKIHTKEQLLDATNHKVPVIGEIPFSKDVDNDLTKSADARGNLIESIRIIIANLKFSILNKKNSENAKKNGSCILVTSSIKGEGKTIISTNLAKILSNSESKVLLIGSDLRNPQIHKYLGVDKNTKGLTNYMFSNEEDYKKFIIKNDNLDVIISGAIPPNPNIILTSEKLQNLVEKVKTIYDYVIIDSAPCLLVSDTFEISKLADLTLYVTRSNLTEKKLTTFINENIERGKLPNVNLILNSVGASGKYGYKYLYQYGYKYSYTYNYGYSYGYNEDKN